MGSDDLQINENDGYMTYTPLVLKINVELPPTFTTSIFQEVLLQMFLWHFLVCFPVCIPVLLKDQYLESGKSKCLSVNTSCLANKEQANPNDSQSYKKNSLDTYIERTTSASHCFLAVGYSYKQLHNYFRPTYTQTAVTETHLFSQIFS